MMPLLQRRLLAEWQLLQELAALNPGRLTDLSADDTTFHGTLHGVAAWPVGSNMGINQPAGEPPVTTHAFRVYYPVHFPAVPMELYLQAPMQHPNIHPESGFVCLWERHRADASIEVALHKLTAMLPGHLHNPAALHIMQPEALARMGRVDAPPAPLTGVRHTGADALRRPAHGRRRLS